jgi:hypothetical protein
MKLHETKFSSHLKWEQNNFIQGGWREKTCAAFGTGHKENFHTTYSKIFLVKKKKKTSKG